MVVLELSDQDVNRIFRALADATRRDIVRRTLVTDVSVSQLADSYEMSFAAVQKHVAGFGGGGTGDQGTAWS
jgi:DNA-binding transcriptional ArsR family regulator